MRHVFLINPKAGKRQDALELIPRIHAYFAERGGDYRIHETTCAGDATVVAREEAARGDVRLYACGGDGTLAEVVAGVVGTDAEIAPVPCGSGNDYVRMLGGMEVFSSLESIIEGRVHSVDGIRCTSSDTNEVRYSLNICALGMDAEVAHKMVKYKHLPLVSGSMAYQLAIVDVFCHRIGHELTVTMDTEEGMVTRTGRFLFALAASGQYYGGGYHGAPRAMPHDGKLDFVLIDYVRRPQILQFLPKYKSGKHLSLPICHSWRGTRMRIQTATDAVATVDGECFVARDVQFELLQHAFRVVLPAGVGLLCAAAGEVHTPAAVL